MPNVPKHDGSLKRDVMTVSGEDGVIQRVIESVPGIGRCVPLLYLFC